MAIVHHKEAEVQEFLKEIHNAFWDLKISGGSAEDAKDILINSLLDIKIKSKDYVPVEEVELIAALIVEEIKKVFSENNLELGGACK